MEVKKNIIKKKIPLKKVYRTVGSGSSKWYEGKLYSPLKEIKKNSRDKIVGSIQLGNSNRFLYTLDKKRRTRGFAPKRLL